MAHHWISADALTSFPWKGVTRRDGAAAPFDAGRIRYAIARAGQASGQFEEAEAERLTGAVLAALLGRFPEGQLEIEDIQDEVEWTLMREGQFLTARAYVIYRAQHTKIRHDRRAEVDAVASINEYLDRQDWRVQANANQGYSLGGLILNSAGKLTANY